MVCDRSGNLWISMKNGSIYLYDRSTDTFVSEIVLSDYITEAFTLNDMLFDHEDRLWLGLSLGLYIFDRSENKLFPVTQFDLDKVRRIIQANDSTFFVSSNGALFRLNVDKVNNSFFMPERIALPADSQVESLHVNRENLYVGTFSHSAFSVNLDNNKITSFEHLIPNVPIRSIESTPDDIILFAADGSGLYSIDGDSGHLIMRYVSLKDDKTGLSGNTVSDIVVDERNCVWVSTSTNGVSIMDPQFPETFWTRHEQTNKNSLVSNHVNVLMEDSEGDIWYGTNNGVSLYEVKKDKWTHFLNDKNDEKNIPSVVLALSEDKQHNIWVGGFGMATFRINKRNGQIQKMNTKSLPDKSGLPNDYIFSIYAEDDNVIFGGMGDEVVVYNIPTNSYSYLPAYNATDIKGNEDYLFLATREGLGIINKTEKDTVWHKMFNNEPLRYPIRCFIQASNGVIWMATNGQGLIGFNPETGVSDFFTTKNGIASDIINSLSEDNWGNIWFTTEERLYRLDLQTKTVADMNEYIDVNWGHFNRNSAITRKNGNLIFGTANGAIEFSPDFEIGSPNIVSLLFTDFKLLYQSIEAGSKDSPLKKAINETSSVELDYTQNSFSISFSAINFIACSQVEYEYMLEGFEGGWHLADFLRTANYMNIEPGDYVFKLRAINKYTRELIGEKSVKIIIGKPFWASNAALVIYFVILFLLLLFVVQYMRNKIEKHNSKEKIRFFINVAHDIRIPVTLIKAPLGELEMEEKLSERGKKSLSIAIRNAEKLFAMVTQLLDLQKVDVKAEKLAIVRQDVNSYMLQKVNVFRAITKQKGIELSLETDPDFPEVWFDPEKMDKIIDNLLSNAIKYTEDGYVKIVLKYTINEWSVEIKDTGIGIPLNEQRHLFKQFYRASNTINSEETGSGIGLLLAKKLVELHKGSITFSSNEQKGSSFILSFPLTISSGNQKEKKQDVISAVETKEKSLISSGKEIVLLAEDDKDIREYLIESLSGRYQVIGVADGKDALEQAKEINPDIIISDILMPVLRGDEMCRQLKSSVETSHIPIILLSGLHERENILQGLEAGADDYILKPFDVSVLKARMRNILQNREKLRQMVLSGGSAVEEINYANELDKEFMDKALKVIEDEMDNPDFMINEFCKALGMSRTSVYKKIKTLTDQGPNEFIRIIRLNRAKELIKSKRYSISEVSLMVGFSDPRYFSTSFKKQFGINPSKVN